MNTSNNPKNETNKIRATKGFLSKIISNEEKLKITEKKFLNESIKLLNEKLSELSNDQRFFLQPKNENFFQFSVPFESLRVRYEYTTKFITFLKKNLKIKKMDDKFVENESIVKSTKKYVNFLINNTSKGSFSYYMNYLITFFHRLIVSENFKVDKSFLESSLQLVKNYKKNPQKNVIKLVSKKNVKKNSKIFPLVDSAEDENIIEDLNSFHDEKSEFVQSTEENKKKKNKKIKKKNKKKIISEETEETEEAEEKNENEEENFGNYDIKDDGIEDSLDLESKLIDLEIEELLIRKQILEKKLGKK